jgi:hypothetical protein
MAPENLGGPLLEGVLVTGLRPDGLEVRPEAETDHGPGAPHRAHAVPASQAPIATCPRDTRHLLAAVALRVGDEVAQQAWISIVVSVPETARVLLDDVIEADLSSGGRLLLPGVVYLGEARRGG